LTTTETTQPDESARTENNVAEDDGGDQDKKVQREQNFHDCLLGRK
jgi:hypothetical protein